jgi:hypothetical protein
MKRTISIVFVLLLFAELSQGARETQLTPTVGGGGGEPLALYCDESRFLTGLNVRSGLWIDAVGIICGRVEGSRRGSRSLVPEPNAGIIWETGGHTRGVGGRSIWGGQGGGLGSLRCNTDEVVAGVRIQRSANNFVGHIQLRCASLNDPARPLRDGPAAGPGSSPTLLDCPFRTAAIGFYGARGDYVDRFGLVCAEVKLWQVAVAVAVSAGDGRIWGASIQSDGKEVADSDAVRRCGKPDCRVVLSETGRCIAIGRSDFNGVWYGWAYGNDPTPLGARAIAACEAQSKPGTCKIVHSNCL